MMIDSDFLLIQPKTKLIEALKGMRNSTGISSEQDINKSSSSSRVFKWSSYALVVEAGMLLGILTERDIVRLTAEGTDLKSISVSDVMTRPVITIQEIELKNPFAALSIFRQYHIRHLPVLNDQKQIVGVVTQNSIRNVLKSRDLLRTRQVKEVMSNNVVTAMAKTAVMDLAKLMSTHRVSCVVIIEDVTQQTISSSLPIGIVTERDIVQFQILEMNLNAIEAEAVMSSPLVCLKPQDDLWQAHQTMERLHVRRLVVANDDNNLVGIVTQTSILTVLDPIEMQNS